MPYTMTKPNQTQCSAKSLNTYLPTPPLGQNITQGQFLSGV